MPTTDGIFMLEYSQPQDVDGQPKTRGNWMLVFAIDPYDIAGTDRYLPTPAHTDGNDQLEPFLPAEALLLLQDSAPQIITALNNGTAYYTTVGISFDFPIDMVAARAEVAVIWQKFSDGGIKNFATDRYANAGDWTELTPAP